MVVVGLLLTLAFVGLVHLPFLPVGQGTGGTSGGGPGGGPQALTYHQAENIANQTAAARGGSWTVAMAMALAGSSVLNPPSPAQPCQLFGYSPVSTSLIGTGRSYEWGFEYGTPPIDFNSGHWPDGLFIVVSNGTGTVTTQTDPFGNCPGLGFPGVGALPSNLTDSPQAASVAQANGGAAFLAQYPSAMFTQAAYVYSLGLTNTYGWLMRYLSSGCTSPTATLVEYAVATGGTNGTLMYKGWSNSTCGNTLVGAYTVGLQPTNSGHSGGNAAYFDNLTITATSGLTTTDLGLAVFEPNRTLVNPASLGLGCYTYPFTGCGGAPQGGLWYAFLVQGGAVVAVYPNTPSSNSWNTAVNPVPISGPLTLELVSSVPFAGSGDTLEAFSYSATVSGSATL